MRWTRAAKERPDAGCRSALPGFIMNVVICPRELTHSRERFEPTHLVSLQDPGAQVAHLRPPWVPADNHLIRFFRDDGDPSDPEGPTRPVIESIVEWLSERCAAGSAVRLMVHCNAGMSRSPAVGYLAWAIHLGPGREMEAYQRMLWSCVRPFIAPNAAVVELADDILGRDGALCRPLNRWAESSPWARRPR